MILTVVCMLTDRKLAKAAHSWGSEDALRSLPVSSAQLYVSAHFLFTLLFALSHKQ